MSHSHRCESVCECVSKSGVEDESDVTGEAKGFPDTGSSIGKEPECEACGDIS